MGLVREGERQQWRRSRDLGGRGRRGGAATAGGVAGLEDCSKDATAAREEGDVWCVRAMCVGAVCVGACSVVCVGLRPGCSVCGD